MVNTVCGEAEHTKRKMYEKVLIFLSAINHCLGQSFNSPPVDWIQTDGTGAYRFGYATGDEGRHYHVSSATADNTVAGRFGFRDPETGGDLQTTYTAGKRGFRARGPHIARRMDLSQNNQPFSRPNDDGQYHPELDNYFDPNEDRGYDFSYRTSNHIKEEHADRVGDVQGRYSYLDDIGIRHNVEYIAGSKTGFVVTNPVPDTFAQARGGPLYFVGKGGGSQIRGFSAVQKNLNGAYRFLASGPDHKRSEISDSVGNRRGVYTYLDDKGVQHTVEYIAGPKIGYKVINNKKGVSYNPVLPFFPDSSTVQPLFPSSTEGGNSGSNSLSPVFSTSAPSLPPKGEDLFTPLSPSSGVSFSSVSGKGQLPSSLPSSSISSTLPKPSDNKIPSHSSSGRPPSSSQPSTSTDSDLPFSFGPPEGFPPISSTFPSTSSFSVPAKPQHPGNTEDSSQKWNYDFDYFFNSPLDSNKDWSKPLNKPSSNKVASTMRPPTFQPLPDPFSSTPFPDPTFLTPNSFNEGLNTAESGNSLKPPTGNKRTEICSENSALGPSKNGDGETPRQPKGRNEQIDFSGSSFDSSPKDTKNSWEKQYYNGRKALLYPSRGTVKFGGAKKNEWHKTAKEEGYFAIPPGVAVRAHVQSLDIVPFKRFESPEEALKHHDDKSQVST